MNACVLGVSFGTIGYNQIYFNFIMQQQVQLKTYTPEEVAEVYKVSKNTVYKMIKEGRIAAKRINDRLYRIPQTELAWVVEGIDSDLLEMEKKDLKLLDGGARKALDEARAEVVDIK